LLNNYKKHKSTLTKKIMPNQCRLHVQQLTGYEEIDSMTHQKNNVDMRCKHYSLLWWRKRLFGCI